MFTAPRVALFSDLHIGVHKNSVTWHNIALEFGDWLVIELSKRGIKDVVFCGDFFHTRHEIEQTTLNCGSNFLKKLRDFNVTMITGNHCCYFRDNSQIHSLELFKEWKNVTVYDTPTLIESYSKKIMFCPWGCSVGDMQQCDIAFGHFEIVNFKMNSFKVCEHGEESTDLLEKADTVITGHFHMREHRRYDDKKSILYLGSPYEMDFGERGHEKGITILDLVNNSTEFVPNKLSPRHEKIFITDLIDKKITLQDVKELTKNNFISLVINKQVDINVIDQLNMKINSYTPLEFRVEHNTTNSTEVDFSTVSEVGVDIPTAINEFIKLMDIDVPREKLYTKAMEIYNNSLVNL